ncbi:MAG: hypothetical protein AB4372_10100 [Xenococcus sp. (in: cyanobacteria)]
MADLNEDKISIFSGINDLPTQATEQQGCNGAWMVRAINNLIEEVNLLKSQPAVSAALFTITTSSTCEEEFNYITLISPTKFDFTGVSVAVDNPDPFVEFYLEVNSAQRLITDVGTTQLFTIDNPVFQAGDSIDLVLVADESLVTEGYSEEINIVFTGNFSPQQQQPPAP